MATIRVHNITDRPNTPGGPKAYAIGGQRLGPGKSVVVDRSVINGKLQKLHGSRLWFGPLHGRFVRTSKTAQKTQAAAANNVAARPMTLFESRDFLKALTLSDLQDLCRRMSPALSFRQQVSHSALVARLSRALFQPSRELDPEHFFWLRRWRKILGNYHEME
jgi:hypothetical protein